MIDISICICTRKRKEGLKCLLDSIEKMHKPSDSNIRVIVVENDVESFSKSIIHEFSLKTKLRISYYLEPRQGLVYARNRSVKEVGQCDFCCFVDDDQAVAPDWLIELVKCQREFEADAVWGPNPPIFNKKVPLYIRKFHTPSPFEYGEIIKNAFTNCLMIRKEYLDKIEGPFDIRLNFTGGEDSYLTYLITNLGAVIRYNPDAKAYEIIPDDRATVKYIIKRTFRIGNAGLYVNSLKNKNFSGLHTLLRLTMRLCFGFVICVPYLCFGGKNKLDGLIKMANAIGGIAFIFGRENQFYK